MLDNDNLLWALRYRVYHRLSEQEIVNYTLPFGYRVRDEDIRAIAAGQDVQQVVLRLHPQLEGLGQLTAPRTSGLMNLERHLQEHLTKLCRATFGGNPFHVGLPIAYLVLVENEIRNLTTLVEAKASQLAPVVFEPLLVH
jgi:vacuolar-type H+-ATPase subunit C/Vma6